MTGIVEKVLQEALKKIEVKLNRLLTVLEGESPLVSIANVRRQAVQVLADHAGDYKAIGELIEPLAAEEKRLLKNLDRRTDLKSWDQRLQLENDKATLMQELSAIKYREHLNR